MTLFRKLSLISVLIAAIAVGASASPETPHHDKWDAPSSDEEVIAWMEAKRVSNLEERLRAVEDGITERDREWVVLKVRLDWLFYAIGAVGSFVALSVGGLAMDWVRKRLRIEVRA